MQSQSALYRRLLSYVKPYRKQFSWAILAMVVVAITEPALPALLKPLLDEGFVDHNQQMMLMIPLILIGIALVRGAATFISQVGITWVAARVIMDLRQLMFARLLSLPSHDFDNQATGMLLSKLSYDVNRVMQAATEVLVVLVRDSLSVIGLLAWMFYLNWQLSLIVFSIMPIIALIIRKVSRRLRTDNQGIQQAMGEMTRILEESISGHKLVKIFGGQVYEQNRFNKTSDAVRGFEVKVKVTSNISIFLVQMLTASVLALIIYIAAYKAGQDEITVGGFISLFTAMGMLFAPIKRLTKINEQFQQGLAAAQSVFELLDKLPEQDHGKAITHTIRGDILFKEFNFSYEQDPVLQHIDLHIKAGETVAFVGASGSGKTTLVNSLPRFYDLADGQVFVDDIDIKQLSLVDLRAQLSLVSQEVVLFNDTVAANIAYGNKSNATLEDIKQAAKAAHALDFIEALSEGFNTMIGERGVKLSGGQRQRLAIARALLKNAPILIFDEATSALDNQSEQAVQAALETLQADRTTLIIAHRLSTIEKADRIVVMDQGRIVEMGKHADLLAKQGVYAQLYQGQLSLKKTT